MKILHLSDFHYKSSAKDIAAQNLLVEKLCEDLVSETDVDFLIFTGDLVFSGKDRNDFDKAYEDFLFKVGKTLGLNKRQIIICPGNHDVNRAKVNEPIKEFLRKIDSNEKLSSFVEKDDPNEFGLSCLATKNYFDFEKKFYEAGENLNMDNIGQLVSLHFREIDNQSLGFVSINTAWCSTGDDDRGNLFFPKSELEKAVNELNKRKIQWKVLLLHHPIVDLKDFNKQDIEDFIYSEFHFLFSGHLHKREDFVKLTLNEGIFGTYASAAFTKKDDGKIGYSVVDIDLNTLDICLFKHFYDFEERAFLPANAMYFSLPTNQDKVNQINIYKTLKKRLVEITDKANELLVTTKDVNHDKDFLKLFVDPVLKTKPDLELTNATANHRINFNELYAESNYLIYGKDKTGKTSLLFKLQIDILKNYTQLSEVPFYIDLNEYKIKPERLDIVKLVSKFLELSYEKTITILKKYAIKLLVDNFDPTQKDLIKIISDFFKKFPHSKYIIVADQTLVRSYEKLDYGIDGYTTLFIHDISRKEIRQLTNKWPNLPENRKEEFIERIIDVLKQHNMPFNYWTLSIFLWIFSGKNTLNFNSNSELIELYIDDLLDRNGLANNPQNRFSYQNFKLLLSELAHWLLTQHSSNNYSIKYSDLIRFTENFMSANPKRVGNTSDVVSYLLERGVLKKIDNDFMTFRLNGVFEYFIAFSFNENKDFLQQIINDDRLYLSFKNEYEIYSGFQRSETDNKEFLTTIYEKTKCVFSDLNDRMTGELDIRLSKILDGKEILDLSQPISELANNSDLTPLTNDEKDELLDDIPGGVEVEVRPKRLYDVSIKDFEILERFLVINGRVFKNIENIKDKHFIEEIFDFIISSSCNLGFKLIEELESNPENFEELDHKIPSRILLSIINNHLPSIVQNFIHSAMGHINLESIIKDKANYYKSNQRINQYRLFILHGLLLDLDLKRHKGLIDEMIEISKIGVVKTSVLIKLLSLLLFKCYDDDKMINFLKEKIRKVNLMINPKVNMKDFDRNFEKTRKILLLKRQNGH
jgi:predicted MPP superfamily phosphohydrolase